jgi:hypothetical protein
VRVFAMCLVHECSAIFASANANDKQE